MLERTFDWELVHRLMSKYFDDLKEDNSRKWVEDTDNIALVKDDNIFMFERAGKGFVDGHFFLTVRGKEAIELCHHALLQVFGNRTGVEVIRGYTPIRHLGARWMSKKLGFKSHGVVTLPSGHYELFILSKSEWNK